MEKLVKHMYKHICVKRDVFSCVSFLRYQKYRRGCVQCATQWQTKIGPEGSINEMRLLCFCGVVTLEYHIHSQILQQPFCFLIPLRNETKKFMPRHSIISYSGVNLGEPLWLNSV